MDPATAALIRRLFDIDQEDRIELPESLVAMHADFLTGCRKVAPGAASGAVLALLVTTWKMTHPKEAADFQKFVQRTHSGEPVSPPKPAPKQRGRGRGKKSQWLADYVDVEEGRACTVELDGQMLGGSFYGLPNGKAGPREKVTFAQPA